MKMAVNPKEWENEMYGEILEAYQKKQGLLPGEFQESFVYREIVKLMRQLKIAHKDDLDELKEAVTNALLLIISLFLNDKDDDDGDNGKKKLSKEDHKYLKKLFSHAIDFANGNGAGAAAS